MKTCTLFCCALLAAAAMQAQIIHVPGDYPTIQEGINAAIPGDTVLVAEGTYYEQINFLGKKPLMVASQFLIDDDTSHIANTIINGSQPLNHDSASVVYFVSGEDTTSVLCGFTITGGTGTTIITPDTIWGLSRQGGGIWISGSGATIRSNIITKNGCKDLFLPGVWSDNGGGIATDVELDDFWVVIEDNVIDSNYLVSDTSYGVCSGAGIAIFYNCRIINNIIKNNVSKILVNTVWWSQGAGAIVAGLFGFNTNSVIQNNQFLNNLNNSNYAFGGGLKVALNELICTNNTFIGNRVESDVSIHNCWGGGLEAAGLLKGSVISNNTFKDNYSEKTYGGLMLASLTTSIDTVIAENNYFLDNKAETSGGGCGVQNCRAILQNNVFSGNEAGMFGGAIYMYKDGTVDVFHLATLINNSFSMNKSNYQGGAIYSVRANPLIINSVFWADSAITGEEIYSLSPTDTLEIAFSNIDTALIRGNKLDGGGNISDDPLFEDLVLLTIPDYSPCFNAGTEEFTCQCGDTHHCPAYDIAGKPRPLWGGFDMGAHEWDFPEGYPDPGGAIAGLYCTTYPNPFSGLTTISYVLTESSNVHIMVFNTFGQLIAEPVNASQPKGEQRVQWNGGNLPSGMYFYRIEAGGKVGTGKMVKW